MVVADPSLLEVARSLRGEIIDASATIDRQRRLPDHVVDTMKASGVFRMNVPAEIGGLQTDPFTMMDVVEEYAYANGSAGWIAGIVSGVGTCSAYLPPEVGRLVFADDPSAMFAGNFAASTGKAVAVAGGYQLTGRWPFGSGCEYATWFAGNSIVYDGDRPRLDAHGNPVLKICAFPAADVAIHRDTWEVSGLRGTGSYDFSVSDLFVPDDRAFWWSDGARFESPLYAARFFLFKHPRHVRGMARRAYDSVVELIGAKTQQRSSSLVRDRSLARMEVAQAKAIIDGCKSAIDDVAGRTLEVAERTGEVPLPLWTDARIAITYWTHECTRAIDLLWDVAGGHAPQEALPIEAAWRDAHVATQHGIIANYTYDWFGNALLDPEGVPADVVNRIR